MAETITYENKGGNGVEISLDFQEKALESLSKERREYFKENEYDYEQYISLYHTYTEDYLEPHIPFSVFERQIQCVDDMVETIYDTYGGDNPEWFQRYFNLEKWLNDLTDDYTTIVNTEINGLITKSRLPRAYAIDMNNLDAE
jgi:hypothetical protein